MRLTRRRLIGNAAAGGAAAMMPAAYAVAAGAGAIPFYGKYQAGITTPPQGHLQFCAFDVTAGTAAELRNLLRSWGHAAALMTSGRPIGPVQGHPSVPGVDTGEAMGLGPARLTITFGFGPGLFDDRFGLAAHRPAALIDMPDFNTDQLDSALVGGDLGVQACSDDPQVAFHVIRELGRIAAGAAALRWAQAGFGKTPGNSPAEATRRNLMGFKDGTNNLDPSNTEQMASNVWVGASDSPKWMRGGTYLVTRRIRMRLDIWDANPVGTQETVIGRTKVEGAPLGEHEEYAPVDVTKLPLFSHIRQANPRRPRSEAERILRRSFSFSDGRLRDGTLDAGLFFEAYQRDPRRQFVSIQRRLAGNDQLNLYTVHTGSAIFACPPGARRGGYVGETLLG